MKLTTGILAITITMAAGTAGTNLATAQNVDAIDNARSVAKSLQQKEQIQTDQALNAAGVPATKPAPGAPAPAVKPAVIPGTPQIVMTSAPTAKPPRSAKSSAIEAPAGAHNQLKKVNVVAGADSFRIELVSSETVQGKVSKLKSPDRVLVELPGTVAATRENRINVGDGGIKGIRIGTDGKNPPTTSVVVDLEKACAYELTPGPSGTLVLTLHTDGVAQDAAKAAAPGSKQVQTVAKTNPAPAPKPVPAAKTTKVAAKPMAAAKTMAANPPASKPAQAAAKQPKNLKDEAKVEPPPADADLFKPKAEAQKPEEKKWAMTGKRDPFFSPVVQQNGSGCSTGKKCLEIGNINLRGVVKSDSGFIAVVTNNLNKAYFLRENDPVFNGYVVKITGDSVVFQETVEDKLGKQFTREVVKRIFTPAV